VCRDLPKPTSATPTSVARNIRWRTCRCSTEARSYPTARDGVSSSEALISLHVAHGELWTAGLRMDSYFATHLLGPGIRRVRHITRPDIKGPLRQVYAALAATGTCACAFCEVVYKGRSPLRFCRAHSRERTEHNQHATYGTCCYQLRTSIVSYASRKTERHRQRATGYTSPTSLALARVTCFNKDSECTTADVIKTENAAR
jgi:hypothetical protein